MNNNLYGIRNILRKRLLVGAKIISAGVVAFLVLNLFCFFYGYSGIHIENNTGATDYTWLSHMLRTNMEEGFSAFHFDEYGFNNIVSDDHNSDILLIGSSHMEAIQVQPFENTGALLNQMLPDFKTYNIGISGHNIYTSVKNLKTAVSYYRPSQYVILETNQVTLDDEKIDEVIEGKYPKIPSYSKGLFYQSQIYFPVIKTIYKKVSDWKNAALVEEKSSNSIESAIDLNKFLNKASKDAGRSQLIIMYHPALNLNDDGTITVEDEGVEKFQETCQENGIIFVDMTGDFENLYYTEHKLPYGFINTGVGIGHLNKYGHEVIAERLSKTIQELEEQK